MTSHPSNDALDTLTSLTVRDVMNRTVVTLDASLPMAQAAQLFFARDVSCAPVVNRAGHCVGILSAADFVRREVAQSQCSELPSKLSTQLVQDGRGPWTIACDLPDIVEHYMTPAVQSIAEERSVLSAARVMCDGHLHRLVVLDTAGAPVGMVSTMDVIAALLNALDEASIRQLLPG
jgi:CBS domain-containing membrane protein